MAEGSATAVLVVGHGTRDPQGQAEYLQVVEWIREMLPSLCVETGILELAEPDIPTGIRRVMATKPRRLVVTPILLFAANHAKSDIPEAVEAAMAGLPDRPEVLYTRPLECDTGLAEVSAERFWEAHRQLGSPSPESIAVLYVGRGSSDPTAISEARRFTELRQEITPTAQFGLCFMAAHHPRLAESLQQLQANADRHPEIRHLIIQPHLLFQGAVLRDIVTQVEAWQQRNPAWKVEIAGHLGATRQLAKMLVDRIRLTADSPL
ncbi:MAG: Sirohydrochlorin cobaltochelatase [Planctomycetota bacterium]|jgi:sirohydrochlorin cobaltochelatase